MRQHVRVGWLVCSQGERQTECILIFIHNKIICALVGTFIYNIYKKCTVLR
jgi:hypothetical protein